VVTAVNKSGQWLGPEARLPNGLLYRTRRNAIGRHGQHFVRVGGVDLPIAFANGFVQERCHGGYATSAFDIGFELYRFHESVVLFAATPTNIARKRPGVRTELPPELSILQPEHL